MRIGILEAGYVPADLVARHGTYPAMFGRMLQGADGSLVCARESDPDHICPTKLLWTRVRGSIVRTLQETRLSDLIPAETKKRPVAV